MKVKLSEVIEAIEFADQYSTYFLDAKTGEMVYTNDMAMTYEEKEAATTGLDEHGFYRLPTAYDIHEYGIMEDFVYSLPAPACDRLADAIMGKGAFRRFKNMIRRFGVEEQWYEWRDNAYRRLAVEWCEECGIEYET